MKKKKEPQTFNQLEAEIAITSLHATGDYLVLRKVNLDQDSRFSRKSLSTRRIGLCLDTETTGLNQTEDKIIELGIVAFEYEPTTGEITRITGRYNGFEDPGHPLAKEIIEITGITDEMIKGQQLDDSTINQLAEQACLVIAHNAAFDRPFVEQRFPRFKTIPWACTVTQIDWQAERLQARSLEYLLFKFGWCINAHRALDDAEGVLGLLLEQLPISGNPVFKVLLENSAESITKLYAVNSPFDRKDLLKQRGYRWSDGSNGTPKSWWISIPESREQEEFSYLATEIYPGGRTDSVEIRRVSPLDRFSCREG
ncbi:MAG: DNA polymerase III subunit epsilon [Geobacteraceae bacterium]|nr:DNA polymerase III subunit epsilon [Geobacteraceae bacterium]